jgi:two-component system, NarL family, response regulator DegU
MTRDDPGPDAAMTGPIGVVIVDDHPLFRQGLRQAVEADPRFRFIGEAGDGPAGLKLILEAKPDIAVLDVNLPGLSGLEVARKLQLKRHRTRLIVLTMYNEEETCNLALDLGVKGYVLKENAVQDILTSLSAVAAGQHYLSPSISGYLVNRRSRAETLAARKPGLDDLTRAERRVLKAIAEQKTSREIAAELFISPRTVEAHRANICAKLELRGSHSLLRFALENRASI